ncbi:LysR family transcriptional regulator [Bacillus fonticola]|uniref:LysR family transcriptional regulator n=1 Tax=Bacillus fonticola TaxID=2728853 RepID=UPI00147446A7|nr:LysR family transcriptional regulator [Bacillus fonticola]
METSWLRTFCAAARHENFRKASEELFVSQPTVTLHIQRLETHFGIQLFQRTKQRVQLTEEGRIVFAEAKRYLQATENLQERVHSLQQGRVQPFHIAISPVLAETVLPTVLTTFQHNHPQVDMSIQVMESKEIEEAVLRGGVDYGVSCLPARSTRCLTEALFEEPVICIAPHDGVDHDSGPPLQEEEVFSQFTLFTDHHPGIWGDLYVDVQITYPQVKMIRVSQVHIAKRFVEEGLGFTYVPASTVRRERLEGRVMEIFPHRIQPPKAHAFALMKYNHSLEKAFTEMILSTYMN